MWIAKLKITHQGSLTIPYAKKHNITILAYPMNHYFEGNTGYLTTGHFVLGREEDRINYFNDVIKNKRVLDYEMSGNLLIYTFSHPRTETHLQAWFSPQIMFLKPAAVKPDGFQYYELASWKKENLADLIKKLKKHASVEILSLKNEPITDIFTPHLMPPLSKKQKETIMLAYEYGYYNYPKGINIRKLAKKIGLSESTLQEHLRLAEGKLMPFLLENIVHKKPET